MSGGKGYTFQAENEEDLNEWMNAFNVALKKGNQENNPNDEILDKGSALLI